MKNLVVAEHNSNTLSDTTLNVLGAAAQLADDTDLLVAGYKLDSLIEQIKSLTIVDKIIVVDSDKIEHNFAEDVANIVIQIADEYQNILVAHNSFGKNILPRIAGKLQIMPVADVVQINTCTEFVRPMYAGNILATVQSTEKTKLLSIRTTCFAKSSAANKQSTVENLEFVQEDKRYKFIEVSSKQASRPELSSAKVVVAGGRSLQSAENFTLIEQLADLFAGAVGATRAAVDAGYIANEYQVGQTGKIIAPEIYFAVGISGAIQHIAGIKDSKIIVAINQDPEAAIFKIADFGIVGDLFQVVPELVKKLSNK